jgi:tRNA pseudouridine55 synthase
VGHAGTLDPLATGVLPVLLGRATRLMDLVQSGTKTYIAEITLGTATETDDAEGAPVCNADVPPLDRARIEAVLSRFVGEIDQTPPKYSALKVGGQRAYALARGGATLELAPRPITIQSLNLLDFAVACLRIEVSCSKGTYIRALARDIALALGTVGHMSSLIRTRVGPFTIEDSIDLAHLVVREALLPANRAMPDARIFNATDDEARRLLNGQPVDGGGLQADHVWVYDPEGRLIGLGSADGILLRPRLAL